jgi:hypothetical protein
MRGESRIVPDFISLFPVSAGRSVRPFSRNLCDRRKSLDNRAGAIAKFFLLNHKASVRRVITGLHIRIRSILAAVW